MKSIINETLFDAVKKWFNHAAFREAVKRSQLEATDKLYDICDSADLKFIICSQFKVSAFLAKKIINHLIKKGALKKLRLKDTDMYFMGITEWALRIQDS